jgi:DNA-binding transcriptional ArsR family regulator
MLRSLVAVGASHYRARVAITWSQALAWRMQRQLLEPVGRESVADVVRRLGAVLAMDDSAAELAVRVRRTHSRAGEVVRALEDGRLIKAFAFRGAMHYLSPEDGGAYLALRSAGRQWELPSWQEYYGLRAGDWPAFREKVRQALANGPLTVGELGAAVTRTAAYRHLRPVFDEGVGTLIKPLTWQGDMSFGPPRSGQHTFQRLDENPRWAGVWDLDDAGPHAIVAYFRAYGPATPDHVHYWLGNGLSAGRGRVQSWLEGMGDRLVEVDVAGESAYVLREDVEELMAARPTKALRLLPGHDQWVIGPGTKDQHVVPLARRTPVTRKANLVIAGGVVSGTWAATVDEVRVTWFGENGSPPRNALAEEVARLSTILDRPLATTLDIG